MTDLPGPIKERMEIERVAAARERERIIGIIRDTGKSRFVERLKLIRQIERGV